MAASAGPEDQGRLLEDALMVVRTQAQLMSRFLDQPVRISKHSWPASSNSLVIEQTHGCPQVRVSAIYATYDMLALLILLKVNTSQ